MKTKALTLFFIFITELLNAQLSQQWVNNFCCFDSVAPHTFSYPLNKEINNDTLMLSFYEDDFLHFKKIDVTTGNDIQNMTLQFDTVQSAFYFGGGTTRIANNYITSAVKYNGNTGQCKLFHSSVSKDFIPGWSTEIITTLGKISKPLSDISGNSFYTCGVADSIRIFKQTIGGTLQWVSAFPVGQTSTIRQPYLLNNSLGEVTLFVREDDSSFSNSSVHLIKVNSIDGSVIADTIYTISAGSNHIITQVNDTLKIAYIKKTGQTISFLDINLLSLAVTKTFDSGMFSFSSLTKFSVDTITACYYLKTSDRLLGFTNQDSSLFNINLPSATSEEYDIGDIVFDQQQYLLLAYSINNPLNSPPNSDLKILKVDKMNGTIVSNLNYNDNRNTDDNFIDDYFSGNNYYVLFANNFDNAAILQEETQIGIIKYSNLPLSAASVKSCKSAMLISPNPAHSFVRVNFDNQDNNAEYFLNSMDGKLIAEGSVANGDQISLEKIENGIYTLFLTDKNGFKFASMVVKN